MLWKPIGAARGSAALAPVAVSRVSAVTAIGGNRDSGVTGGHTFDPPHRRHAGEMGALRRWSIVDNKMRDANRLRRDRAAWPIVPGHPRLAQSGPQESRECTRRARA
jgi:hypothetical protein